MLPPPPLASLPLVCYICEGLWGFSKTVRSMFGYLLGRTWCLHCRAPPDAVLCVFVVCVVQSSVAINHTGNVARSKSESALSIELIESMLITKYKALTNSAASHICHYSAACRIEICCLKNGNVAGVSFMAKGRFTVG